MNRYDAAERLTSLATTLATGTGPTYTLAYDDASRITRLTTNVGSSDFAYDVTGRFKTSHFGALENQPVVFRCHTSHEGISSSRFR
jgi:YD repeat-containing protein